MSTRHILFVLLASLACMVRGQENGVRSLRAWRHVIDARYDSVPSAVAARVLAPFLPAVDSLRLPVLGRCDAGMWLGRPECPLGNWAADAFLDEARRMDFNACAAVVNLGGLRAPMPQGEVRLGHIYEMVPYDNRLCRLVMPGSALLQLCREIAATGGEGVSGLSLVITADGRLLDARVGDESIDTTRTYNIVTLEYLAEGNDGLTSFRQAQERQVIERHVRDILVDAVRREEAAGRELHAVMDGRVRVAGHGVYMAPPHEAHPVLNILHTNDTHSQILPLAPDKADTLIAGRGGYLRRAAFLDMMRERDPELLLFDAGDFSQGTLFYNLYRGEVEVRLMNHMRYDAVTIGNHEFDNGLDNMARLFSMACFPVVCANYDFTGTPCEGLVHPYVVLHRRGLRIGVFGLGCRLEGLVASRNSQGVRYIPPVLAADSVVDILRNREHCDLVVCLSHLGFADGVDTDKDFIPQSHGIDLLIGGHTHIYMHQPEYILDRDCHPVPCFQMGRHGCFVGHCELQF